jgi:uncharacterized membrane protein YhhN
MPAIQLLLLLLWGALLFGGFIFGGGSDRRMPRWTRLTSSLILVILAWSWAAVMPAQPRGNFALLIAVGMTLGFVGDLFMARVFSIRGHVLAGMGSFALGHVAYIAAGIYLGNATGLNAPGPRFVALAAWLLIGAAGWYLVVYRRQKPTVMRRAALPYALLLSSTAGIATGLALQEPRLIPFAVGAALFLFSDLLIAAKLFAGRATRGIDIDDLIWLTYGPGQMLIVHALPIALLLGANLA